MMNKVLIVNYSIIVLTIIQYCGITYIQASSDAECTVKQFDCGEEDHNHCVPKRWLCDGSPDCPNESDETVENCPQKRNVTCKAHQFKCKNANCIPTTWQCDGTDDCGDESDESACASTCTSTEFKCKDGMCIALTFHCDGADDCFDGSDEKNCPKAKDDFDPKKSFMCAGGYVIPLAWKCDGAIDCLMSDDEQNCSAEEIDSKSSKGIEGFGNTCKVGEFRCSTAIPVCISKEFICDGVADCFHGDDERNCTNSKPIPEECIMGSEFTCSSDRKCIPLSQKCDGNKDCEDSSDERFCPRLPKTTQRPTTTTTTTTKAKPDTVEIVTETPNVEVASEGCNNETQFTCDNGKCISKQQLCDGVKNCPGREDESREICGINECERNNGGCDHTCVNLLGGHKCECEEGHVLTGKYACKDIDECVEFPGICSQVCINTEGSYHCSCLPGYTREPSNYTRCKADEGEAYLLFSHSYDIRSLRLRDKDMVSVVQDTRGAIALDYSFKLGQLLWSDKKDKKIYRASLANTENREILVESEEVSADGLAVDWIHNHVYYTDTENSVIRWMSWDTKYVKTIIKEELGRPRAIVVSPQKGYLYWTDWGLEPKIERAALNGENRSAIVTHPDVIWPNGLVIDHSTERIYWCDGRLRTISSANLDGSNVQVILYNPYYLRQPFSISVFEDKLYWTDWSQVALFSADKFTGNNIQNVSAGHLLESPKVVHVFHQYRQPFLQNICMEHSCSHFCFRDTFGKAQCDCADGFALLNKIECLEETLVEMEKEKHEDIEHAKEIDRQEKELEESFLLTAETLQSERKANSGSPVGFIIGSIVGIIFGLAVIFGAYVMWNRNREQPIQRIRFNNSVYRKTTADDYDGRGYVIGQDQLFYSHTARTNQIERHLTEADDAPLTPNIDEEDEDFVV